MEKIKEMAQYFNSALDTTVRLAPACVQFVCQPHNFYWERSNDLKQRLREAGLLLAWLAILLALPHYFVITSVHDIKNPTEYVIGSLFFNVVHLFVMAMAFALPAKLAKRTTPFLTHLSNALCATAVLLPTTLVTLAWAQTRVKSTLEATGIPNTLQFGNGLVLAGYIWMGYHIYRGLRSNAYASRGRAVIATVAGLLIVLFWMQVYIITNEALLLHAVTR